MQVIAYIGRGGLVYYKTKFGSNKAEDMQNCIKEVFEHLARTIPLSEVVIMLDNAPCHSHIEDAFEPSPSGTPTLLRLGPYSPMLNPIESVFSAFKADVKRTLRIRRTELLSIPPNTTIKAHRAHILEQATEVALPEITPQLCWKCYMHTRKFYQTVLNMEGVEVGR
ncbi:hypothetical protein DYB32_008108 [Aphanomyces invadans]|uniref:Tc1-like transposase DDE domain-containing protein n=1 Tax=Aphanomyces invadans TaxID=157072 RepID=A0A418AMJ6_9STRA|nr:hypothetical protein DYB32_008108 [Aphanomyces invadans]